MSKDAMGPSVTVHTKLEKFDGDRQPGQEPVEVIETTETLPLAEFLANMERGSYGQG